MKNYIVVIAALLFGIEVSAGEHTGTIRGKITDAEQAEDLIGATVVIVGTIQGAATDIDGSYSITGIAAGLYSIQVNFVGYKTKTITDIVVRDGEVTIVNASLGSDAEQLQEVVISAEALKSSESAMLNTQKRSLNVVDGMGSDQFSRGNDSDAASAIKRITGVSVEGGKYIYVRGLGDRYSKTSLNGADIPSLDPNRNSVQMDLFPSNLIDNILVYKTFSPDLPGDFTGGFINVETKDFPERFTLRFSNSLGYNTQSNFNADFLSSEGGKLDWLGMDDGSRQIPSILKSNRVPMNGGLNEAERGLLNDMGNAFGTSTMAPRKSSRFLNQNHSISFGDQKSLVGKQFGYIAGLSYNRGYSHYDGGETSRYTLPGQDSESLISQLELSDTKSTESILWGAFANLSLKINDNNKVSLNFLRNQSSDKTSRSQFGRKPEDDPDLNYETRAVMFIERAIASYQLKGEHFSPISQLKINWISSMTRASQDEPDLKFSTFGSREFNDAVTYSIEPSIGQIPTRFFRDMEETSFDNKIHFKLPFGSSKGGGVAKFGASFGLKNRAFRENQYRYNSNPTPANFFDGNIDTYVTTQLLSADNPIGTFLVDAFDDGNNYDADQIVSAGYGMVEKNLGDRMVVTGGVRVETTDLNIASFDEDDQPGTLSNVDVLPAVSLTFRANEKMNLKASVSKTIARPTFRELAPFTSFDFIGDYLLVGNPDLERSTINNLDLRWELYSRPGEVLAFSTFYKEFHNPIEKTFNIAAANGNELTWRNTDKASLFGVEAEFRKRLNFVHESLSDFTVGTNFTYVYSKVDIDQDELKILRVFDPKALASRPMFGQSPFIINSFIAFENLEGLRANLTLFMSGDRVSVVTSGGAPNVVEKARPGLNFNVSKAYGRFDFKVSAENLLDPEYKFVQSFLDRDFVFQNYKLGRTFKCGVTYSIN